MKRWKFSVILLWFEKSEKTISMRRDMVQIGNGDRQ
jgi:hypothetical protein